MFPIMLKLAYVLSPTNVWWGTPKLMPPLARGTLPITIALQSKQKAWWDLWLVRDTGGVDEAGTSNPDNGKASMQNALGCASTLVTGRKSMEAHEFTRGRMSPCYQLMLAC